MIVNFVKKKEDYDYKKSVIFEALLNYYKDLSIASGVDIPYFLKAKESYKQKIKTLKDVNYYYNKIKGEK